MTEDEREDLRDRFAEGVKHVAEQQWVSPEDIPDADLRASYQAVIDALEAYSTAAMAFDEALYG